MDHPTTLIYLPDSETLGQLHRDWPEGVRVALCLEERGQSDVVFVREEDVFKVPARVSELFRRDDVDFVIVPILGGYPTRRLSFAEEQQLCGMLADMVDLAGQARSFVAETNDDELSAVTEPETTLPVAEPMPLETPDVPKRAASRTRIIRPEPTQEPAEPVSAPPATAHWGHLERDGAVLNVNIDGLGEEQGHRDDVFAHPVALSDDRRRLQAVLSLRPEDRQDVPGNFQIPIASLPEGCPDIPTGASHRVFVRAEGPALTITLPVLKPARAARARSAPKKIRRRGLWGPAVAAAVALVMVQMGTSQEAKDIMRLAGTYPEAVQDE